MAISSLLWLDLHGLEGFGLAQDGEDLQGDVVRNKFPISVLKSREAKWVRLQKVEFCTLSTWKFTNESSHATRWNSECWVLFERSASSIELRRSKIREHLSLSIRDSGLKVVNRNSNELIQERCQMSSYVMYEECTSILIRISCLSCFALLHSKNSWIIAWQLLSKVCKLSLCIVQN